MPNSNVTKEERKRRYNALRRCGATREVAIRYRDVSYLSFLQIHRKLLNQIVGEEHK